MYNDATLGDVDGDDSVTSKDALIILSHTVGIPVPGTRILLLASPSACASGSAHTLALLPPDPVLVPGQPLKLIPQAQDTAGRVVAADSVLWTSSNPTVAGVDPTGVVTARAAGTAIITAALGPGVRAVDTLKVVGQRYNWYVSAAQTGAPIQVGSSAYPFDTPSKVFPYVSEGDTVRVASGVYNDTSSTTAVLNAGVVILGGTPGDTTTRPLIVDAYVNSNTALILQGGNNTVVRNVAFQNFYETIELDGVQSFELIGSKITAPVGFDNFSIYSCLSAQQNMDSIRIDSSAFIGDSANPAGEAIYYGSCGGTVVHTLVRNTVFSYWSEALLFYDADSTDVLQSQFIGSSEGIDALGTTGIYPALHISHTHFAGVSIAAEVDEARRFALDSSGIAGSQGPEIGGGDGPVPLTETYLQGDTITPPAQGGWLFANAVDTLGVDQTIVQWPDSAASPFSEMNVVYPKITRSQFLNVSNGEQFYFSNLTQALVDSVVMVGCNVAGCDAGYGFEFLGGTGSLNTTVVGSRFEAVAYPIYTSATSGTQIVSETVIDSAALPMQLGGDSAIVTHDSLSRVTDEAVSITSPSTRGASLVAHDSVLCSATAEAEGLVLDEPRAYAVDSNLVSGCLEGIVLAGTAGTAVVGNTLRGPGSYGLLVSERDTALVPIDSNGVSGFGGEVGYGIDVSSGHVYLRGNNVENNYYGLFVIASTPPDSAVGNAFVGNTGYQIFSNGDSIYAVNDWWGAVTGPVSTQLFGPVVSAPFLLSLPGLPSLAPPAGPLATRISLAPTAVTLPTVRTTPVRASRTAPEPPLTRLSPGRAAQITAQRALRSMEVSRETARRAAQSSTAAATSSAIAAERVRRSVAPR